MKPLTREQFFKIQLALSENVGPITYRDLLRYYKSAEAALSHISDRAAKGGRRRPIKIADKAYVEHQIELAIKKDIDVSACHTYFNRLGANGIEFLIACTHPIMTPSHSALPYLKK
jgi:hypothetical protein